jgi:Putative prokaryotic signal transducing protein
MKTIKTYSTRVDAELARIALDAAGMSAVVVGVGVGMEGGTGGVQLLVQDDQVERALKVLGDA